MTDKGQLTYSEISSQSEALIEAGKVALQENIWISKYLGRDDIDEVIFIGSGSSYYQAMTMAATYRSWLGKNAISLSSSEILLFRKENAPPGKRRLLIGVSRSGESTEVIEALKLAKSLPDWEICGITCYENSSMAALCDCLVSPKGKEQSTVMTKSLSSMIILMQWAIAKASGQKDLFNELAEVQGFCGNVVNEADSTAKVLVRNHDFNKTVFLGMNAYGGIAQEGCLKLKEMANVWTENFGTLEFRHGPKSIVDGSTCLVFLLSEKSRAQELKVAEEMKDYGAYVTIVTAEKGKDTDFADLVVEVGSRHVSDEARSVLYLPFLQYYGYYTSLKKGLNPDFPRNLTQVVKL